ncbi:MAG: hypothetical protein HOW97_30410 [Catenulispora sp.]|nr:hypothetical protein [Catenulispora sp.]
MSIEDTEAGLVRGFLGTAFGDAEPPLRDLASGSIARGDRARRRVRWYTAGGTVLAAVAVVGTFALTAGNGGAGVPTPGASATPKPVPKLVPKPVPPDPAVGNQGANTRPVDATAKTEDVQMRLPGLLQPLLPAGIGIQVAPAGYSAMNSNNFLLTGPTGTTQLSAAGGRLDWSASDDRHIGCLQAGGCDVRGVSGGTVYVNDSVLTANAQVVNLPSGSLRPGTEKTVVARDVWMTFIPADRSKPYLQFREATSVAPVPFVAKAPAGWTGQSWPPALIAPGMQQASDPHGVAISADAFAALAVAPGIAEVESVLDPYTPASQSAVTAQTDRNSQITALLAPVLPKGVTASVTADLSGVAPGSVLLTGASGQNMLGMTTMKQDAGLQHMMANCPSGLLRCDRRRVSGGQLVVWVQEPTDSNLHPTANKANNFQYMFAPDDTSKPAVEFSLTTNWMSSAIADPLITLDDFVTATANPHLADIVSEARALAAKR